MPKLNVHQQGLKYQPKVGNNSGKLKSQNFVFSDSSFNKDFDDKLKGTAKMVTLKSLPILPIYIYGELAQVGDTFTSSLAQNVNATLDPKFAIHNAHLYEFTKDIDLIIADYEALGLKLIANESGVLTFMDPNNITDIRFVRGKGIDNKDLEFTFTVTSSVSNLESNTATFSILPWENVNTKTNYIHIGTGGEGTVDNPVVGFVITGDTTKTATITLNDGTELIATFTDNDSADVTVTDTNANPARHEVGTVNGVSLKETVTSLVQPTLTGTVITWKFLNENNVVQEVALDIADALPNQVVDINVDKVEWDVNDTNILKLIETDGTEHNIDLNKFKITTNTNTDGSVSVSQNGTAVFTISHVGITNDYRDLDNLPVLSGEHPNGLKGQLYFIDEHGTNKVIPEYLLKRGLIVQTQREFDILSTQGFDLKEVFNRWDMFSHHSVDLGGGVSPPTFPVFTPDDPQPSTRLEAQEYYDRTLWQYDEVNDRIYLTRNVHPYTGFVSPREYGNFTFEATFTSPNSDDDMMALVIGFWKDPVTGYEHTLSVIRQLTPFSNQGDIVYSVWLNFGQTNAELIHDGSPVAPYPTGTPGGWNVNGPTRVQVVRAGNVYSIKCSQFGSETIDDTTLITIDTDADDRLEPFRNASKVAFAAASQVDARFSNIVFDGLIDYIFWDKETYYDTYEYDPVGDVFFKQDPKTTFARDYFGYCKFIDSYVFDKQYYISEKDEIICFKGDEGVSWDPNNALTIGTDNKPYLHAALVGGTDNRIISFNSGYDSGLSYNTSASWIFNGNTYSETQTLTLSAADATNDRIDVIAVDADGNIVVLEGTPAANPTKPEVNPATQLEATFIIIPANATAPQGITEKFIYNENTQEAGGEWDTMENTSGARIVLNSTNNPYSGTVAVEGTMLEQYDYFKMSTATPIKAADIKQISYRINLKQGIYYPNCTLVVVSGLKPNGKRIYEYLQPSNFGFSHNTYNAWQFISIPLPATTRLVDVDYISFFATEGTEQHLGFYVDNFRIINNEEEAPATSGGVDQGYVDQQDAIIQSQVDDHEARISDNEVDIADHETRITALESNPDIAPTENTYATIAAMQADQANQTDGYYQFVSDASADSTVESGWAYYEYLGTTIGDLASDYRKLSEQESMDVAGVDSAAVESIIVNNEREYNKQQSPKAIALTDAATLSWDLTSAQHAKLLATDAVGNVRTLPNSVLTGAHELGEYKLHFKQDATGNRVINFDTDFVKVVGSFDPEPNSMTIVAITVEAGKAYVVLTRFDGVIEEGWSAGGYQEEKFVWSTGNPQTFTVTDSNRITDVYMNGKRLEKFLVDGTTPDEWQINSATEIEILITLDDQDVITVVGTYVVVPAPSNGAGESFVISNWANWSSSSAETNWHIIENEGGTLKRSSTTDFLTAISDSSGNNSINAISPLFIAPFDCKVVEFRLLYYTATGRTFEIALGSHSWNDGDGYNTIVPNATQLHLETVTANTLQRTHKVITPTNAIISQGDSLLFGLREPSPTNTATIKISFQIYIQKV